MKETVVLFGATASIAGILTAPEPATSRPGSPAVIYLNAGLLHRVGPHRVHVKLARRLGRAGITSLRFDLSGIGDSAARSDGLPARTSATHEIRDAMSYLTDSTGNREFILFGICSGADYAFRVGCADPRVVGLVLVDGYSYKTMRNRLLHYGVRLFRRQSWANVLTGRHPIWERMRPRKAQGEEPRERPALGFYRMPTRQEAETDLQAMVDRGVNLCVVHTHSDRYNHHSQFKYMFPSVANSPQVTVQYLPFADHTFTLLASQNALADSVERWVLDTGWLRRTAKR